MRFNTVFFDFYNTLATFYPPKEKIQKLSAEKFGLDVTKKGITKGYLKADEWMSKEIAKQPIKKLTPDEKLSFLILNEGDEVLRIKFENKIKSLNKIILKMKISKLDLANNTLCG